MRKILVLLVALSLTITACDALESDEKKSGNEHPAPASDENETASEPFDLPDTLIYTAHNGLFRWDFEENDQPELIASDIDFNNISWSPDKSFFIYGVSQGNRLMGMRYDIDSGESIEVAVLVENLLDREINPWGIRNWSPDGSWFLLDGPGFDHPSMLISSDLSQQPIALENNFFPQVVFTEDNQAIAFGISSTFGVEPGAPELGFLEVYDLQNGEKEELSDILDSKAFDDLRDFQHAYVVLYDELRDAGYRLMDYPYTLQTFAPPEYYVTWPETFMQPGFNSPPIFCNDWKIDHYDETTENSETIYETSDTSHLSEPVSLEDGSLIFVRFYYPNCEFGTPVAELLRMMSDGTIEVISNKLASAADNDEFGGTFPGAYRFAVSPDMTYVFWMSFDRYGLERTLNVTDLETMTSRVVTIEGEPLMDIVRMFWIEG